MKYNSLSIYTDYPFLNKYKDCSTILKEGSLLLAGYNHHTHAIDFFDLTAATACHSLPLEKEGTNTVPTLSRIALPPSYVLGIHEKYE